MDPAVVYKELRTMHRKMDIMIKKLDNLDRQVVQNSRQMSTIGIVQKLESKVLRESANSITTLIRMMAVSTKLPESITTIDNRFEYMWSGIIWCSTVPTVFPLPVSIINPSFFFFFRVIADLRTLL